MRPPHLLAVLAAILLPSLARATYIAPDPTTPISDHFPTVNGEVFAIATVSNELGEGTIYVGGAFTEAGGVPRNNLAAFDLETGAVKAWNPDVDGPVRALVVASGVAYFGGAFSQVGGQTRNHLAAVNASSGTVRDWDPNVDGEVRALAFAAGNLYAGGAFATVGGESRPRLAAFAPSLALLPWNPAPDGAVETLMSVGTRLFVGGGFQNITGSARAFAAGFNPANGALATWNPAPNGIVRALASDGATVFAGGDFTAIGGRNIAYAAALEISSAAARKWNAGLNGSVHAIHYFSNAVYLGGDFTRARGASRPRLAALESTTGYLFAWNPGANATVRAIRFQGGETEGLSRGVSKTAVLIGGAFTGAGGTVRQGFAAIRDPMWSSGPRVDVTRIDGKPMRNLGRGYLTRRHRITVSGTASSHTEVGQVVIHAAARGKKTRHILASGTSTWRVTLRLRSRENAFLFQARDRFYDFPIPFITYSVPIDPVLYVRRLAPGETAPSR